MDAVISLTRLTGQPFALNPDLIERVEATPDTVITMVDGAKHVVTESVEGVVDAVRYFRASVVAMSQHLQVAPPQPHPDDDGRGECEAPTLRLVAKHGGDS